ncbi:MAG TPA: SDR family NAD(P)-dependent oxidoreductase [Myxococcota bacterium]|jgi:3-oxoacyl-[acyl-carrier protein] reductase
MDLGLTGKRAIVTGATKGIGRAIAEALVDEGAQVAICSRSPESVEAAKKALEQRGGRVFARAADVGNGEALVAFIDAAAAAMGGIDVFVHNPSGGNGADEKAFRANFEVDLLGAVRSVNAALPHLEQSRGSVIFISTTAAVETFLGPTSYNAIKAALIRHGSGLAQALAPKGIRVNTVSPGPIFIEGGAWDMIKTHRKPMYDATVAAIPTGRLGSAQEVADAVVFLASPRSSFTTGVNLVIDGGFTKRVDF